jgi:hypothetical protein
VYLTSAFEVGILADPDNKPNFWATLPGFMTGLAAVLTAVTGLLVVMNQHRGTRPTNEPAAAVSSKDPAGGSSAAASTAGKQPRLTVLVVGKDGTETKVFSRGFEDSQSGKAFQLKNGQSIPFEKITTVDFMEKHGYEQDVKVNLRDGRAVEGSILAGEQLTGESDIGPFSISVASLKRITFER